MGIPAGIKSPAGNGDGEEMSPVDVHEDGDGENSPPRGRGWWLILRRGIPLAIFTHTLPKQPQKYFLHFIVLARVAVPPITNRWAPRGIYTL
jgi:hypothetical protein